MTTPVSRAQGCLIGQLAGDNLGAQVEFMRRSAIRSKFPDGVPAMMRDGGVWQINAGQPTDDGEMALALARALALSLAFFHLGHPDSGPVDAILDTIERGGDADTNGAIVGAMMGAARGIAAFPAEWVDAIVNCEVSGPDAMCPRPAEYHPNDALALAGKLLRLATDQDANLGHRSPANA